MEKLLHCTQTVLMYFYHERLYISRQSSVQRKGNIVVSYLKYKVFYYNSY